MTEDQLEHKDPSGEICKGNKDPYHAKCWHCDTCPYVECAEDNFPQTQDQKKSKDEANEALNDNPIN